MIAKATKQVTRDAFDGDLQCAGAQRRGEGCGVDVDGHDVHGIVAQATIEDDEARHGGDDFDAVAGQTPLGERLFRINVRAGFEQL